MLGFFFFGEVPDVYTYIGGAMIFASTTYIAVREAGLRRAAKAARAAAVDDGRAPGDKPPDPR
jgi:drug/metabolite transporter (DMT)-like permease